MLLRPDGRLLRLQVTVYRWVVREGSGGPGGCGAYELASECHHLGNVLALYLAARWV